MPQFAPCNKVFAPCNIGFVSCTTVLQPLEWKYVQCLPVLSCWTWRSRRWMANWPWSGAPPSPAAACEHTPQCRATAGRSSETPLYHKVGGCSLPPVSNMHSLMQLYVVTAGHIVGYDASLYAFPNTTLYSHSWSHHRVWCSPGPICNTFPYAALYGHG